MKFKSKGFKFSKLPIKEVMVGEGLLSLSIGILLWFTSNYFAPSVYNFFQHLSLDKMKSFLSIAAQCIFAFGALNILIPVLFTLVSRLIQEKETHLPEKKDISLG